VDYHKQFREDIDTEFHTKKESLVKYKEQIYLRHYSIMLALLKLTVEWRIILYL